MADTTCDTSRQEIKSLQKKIEDKNFVRRNLRKTLYFRYMEFIEGPEASENFYSDENWDAFTQQYWFWTNQQKKEFESIRDQLAEVEEEIRQDILAIKRKEEALKESGACNPGPDTEYTIPDCSDGKSSVRNWINIYVPPQSKDVTELTAKKNKLLSLPDVQVCPPIFPPPKFDGDNTKICNDINKIRQAIKQLAIDKIQQEIDEYNNYDSKINIDYRNEIKEKLKNFVKNLKIPQYSTTTTVSAPGPQNSTVTKNLQNHPCIVYDGTTKFSIDKSAAIAELGDGGDCDDPNSPWQYPVTITSTITLQISQQDIDKINEEIQKLSTINGRKPLVNPPNSSENYSEMPRVEPDISPNQTITLETCIGVDQ